MADETMWPFNRQKKFLQTVFGNYLNKDTVEELMNNPSALELKAEKKPIQFVLLFVKESGPDDFKGLIEAVTNDCLKYDAMIETMTATFISALFNVPLEQDNPKGNRIKLVANLSKIYGTNLSIVHGECECFVGNFGSNTRMSYTALIPGYKEIMKKLASLDYGQVLEV
jgi:hypothetical protein